MTTFGQVDGEVIRVGMRYKQIWLKGMKENGAVESKWRVMRRPIKSGVFRDPEARLLHPLARLSVSYDDEFVLIDGRRLESVVFASVE